MPGKKSTHLGEDDTKKDIQSVLSAATGIRQLDVQKKIQ
jgi:hypothetical protein